MLSFLFHCRRFCKIDASLLQSVADLLLNLSAGWFGLIVITPSLAHWGEIVEMILLAMNVFAGTVAFVLAVLIRRFISLQ